MINPADGLDSGYAVPGEFVPHITGLQDSDPWLQQPSDALLALVRAGQAYTTAESWREFRVGSCGVTLRDDCYATRFVHGANVKPRQDSELNIHAEDGVLQAAGHSILSVVAIVADFDPSNETGLRTATTVPCSSRCTPNFAQELAKPAAERRITSDTLIVTAQPDFSVVQWFDVPTLVEAHATGYHELLHIARFETPGMQDDDEWTMKFFIPLFYRLHTRIQNEARRAVASTQVTH